MSKFLSKRDYYDAFPFYSEIDKVFRFFRDKILGPVDYNLIMVDLMDKKLFDVAEVPVKVFMTIPQLEQLHQKGHSLGLHSDTHPTQIQLLTNESQMREYKTNYDFLKGISGNGAKMVANPCGEYSETTLEFLHQLEVEVGFRSSMKIPYAKSLLELPREDHSNILKKMRTK